MPEAPAEPPARRVLPRMWRAAAWRLRRAALVCIVLLLLLEEASAKARRRRRSGAPCLSGSVCLSLPRPPTWVRCARLTLPAGPPGGRRKTRYSQFYYLMAIFFLVILGPVLFTFASSLWKDPVVPRLLRAAAERARGAVVAHMGRPAGGKPWAADPAPLTRPSPVFGPRVKSA